MLTVTKLPYNYADIIDSTHIYIHYMLQMNNTSSKIHASLGCYVLSIRNRSDHLSVALLSSKVKEVLLLFLVGQRGLRFCCTLFGRDAPLLLPAVVLVVGRSATPEPCMANPAASTAGHAVAF